MTEKSKELEKIIGSKKINVFNKICAYINDNYDMDQALNGGGKKWLYEYKFRKSGKTLCAFYFKEKVLGLMIIFGKQERLKIETNKTAFSKETMNLYETTKTYHDGKWMMIELEDLSLFDDIKELLLIKRRPNKKIKRA
ncbi:MAG: DUF3788 domain-containing protein [Endomicrobium sp.]|jgi:hypothetical protein|nr:DUF3788 domain-containing protein [Endomicrobium sp.]